MRVPNAETKSKNRRSRRCVFCGAGKLSEEHIWSRWARELLPVSDGYREFTHKNRKGRAVDQRIVRDAQGPITNKRLKRVCAPCNNEWMGTQEQVARDIVTKLLQGTSSFLTKSDRCELAKWVTIKLMVLDVFRDGDQVFTEGERRAFYEQWIVPAPLSVWLLRCGEGAWRTLFWSHAQRVTVGMDETWTAMKPPSATGPNMKLFIWGVGEALIVAMYAREVSLDYEMQSAYAIRLVPDQGVCRKWPPHPVTGEEAASLGRTLHQLPAKLGAKVIELDERGEPI